MRTILLAVPAALALTLAVAGPASAEPDKPRIPTTGCDLADALGITFVVPCEGIEEE